MGKMNEQVFSRRLCAAQGHPASMDAWKRGWILGGTLVSRSIRTRLRRAAARLGGPPAGPAHSAI
jgi:hypothetical protein